MSKEKKSKDEEIELGSLFIIIGKGFSNLFKFIASIFKGLFHGLILLLLFVKTNLRKLVIAAVIGALIGTVIEFRSKLTYGADLLVQPNFKSARQLYNKNQYYNDQEKHKDNLIITKTYVN